MKLSELAGMDGVLTLRRPGDSAAPSPDAATLEATRPVVAGKFLRIAGEKLWVKGVTYGTFHGETEAGGYPEQHVVRSDFAAMRAAGVNTVRTYTVPPAWLLDLAHDFGLRLMVGVPWEQHVAFLQESARALSIVARVRAAVRACAGHPAVFCYVVGNEIPASIVRWHGRRRIEKFIRRLYDTAKAEDPTALVTYVNYPTTEYLQLPFLDIVCFNVYLESERELAAYLARLQNLAGEKPLILAELGLDSRRNSEATQAASVQWQLRRAFAAGCAGAFVFGWTDEWFRGGHDIHDWDFGLTTRDRREKPALLAVKSAYAEVPFPRSISWPRISVVVCTYNGARTIRDTLEELQRIDYPDYEVIIVNDGSSDATAEIVREYPVRSISTENRGLSSARNTGWQAATGEIVAFIDDDAYPDAHWLKYLAYALLTTKHVAVGGPNLAVPGDGPVADCVANAPGAPIHVLITDTTAEHIPGCNMASRETHCWNCCGPKTSSRVATSIPAVTAWSPTARTIRTRACFCHIPSGSVSACSCCPTARRSMRSRYGRSVSSSDWACAVVQKPCFRRRRRAVCEARQLILRLLHRLTANAIVR